MMIESVGYTWMAGDSGHKPYIDEVSYLIPRRDVTAQVSLGAVCCYDFPPNETYVEKNLETIADVSITSYVKLGNKLNIGWGSRVLDIDNCDGINFALYVYNCQADATALILFKAKLQPKHKAKSLQPVATLIFVVHDALTGDILHKYTITALPGTTIPSKAQIQQEVIDRIHRKPKTELSVLPVKEGDMKPGFRYKVDVKKKALIETKMPRLPR